MQNKNIITTIISLWGCLGNKRRIQFFLLFLLMMISVVAETLSISSVIPFLSALTNPEKLFELSWFLPYLELLDINSPNQTLLPLTIIFICAAAFAALIRILLLWVNNRLTASMGVQLRSEVFSKTLYQPYEYHIENNTSHLISMTTEKVGIAVNAGILHVLMLVSSIMTSIAIIGILLFINTKVALLTFLFLGGGYILMGLLVRKKIKTNGYKIAVNQPIAVKFMQEGSGGIRDLIMDGTQHVFVNSYTSVARIIQENEMKNSFLSNLPKSLLELMSITFIAILAYILQSQNNSQIQVLPVLGALALGAQRLLPALQQIYFSWSRISSTQTIIEEVIVQLRLNQPTIQTKVKKPFPFNTNIILKNLSYKYNNTSNSVLKSINLEIPKGSRVGFIGTTGSGKSTLIDIIMGLLTPNEGQILIDGIEVNHSNIINWQSNIAHVPQSIFLTDASIAENIAFGVDPKNIDMKKLIRATQNANLDEFIKNLPNGYSTHVGERGVQLSGGQRQRIGIARALYKQAKVIILDEATSALDNTTESLVMNAINNFDDDLTFLIIAHRLSTLKNCNIIYKLESGQIVGSGNYRNMVQ